MGESKHIVIPLLLDCMIPRVINIVYRYIKAFILLVNTFCDITAVMEQALVPIKNWSCLTIYIKQIMCNNVLVMFATTILTHADICIN